jgi:nucleoid-associated protein YgaU
VSRALPAVIVDKGDTLWAIAERELGRSSAWPLLAAANKIADPRKLRIGDLIVIGAPRPVRKGGSDVRS